MTFNVIPVKVGILVFQGFLNPDSPLEACGDKLRRGDGFTEFCKRLSQLGISPKEVFL